MPAKKAENRRDESSTENRPLCFRTITAYLDKSAIGSGELKLIRTGP